MSCDDKYYTTYRLSQLTDRCSMDVSVHNNISYDTVTVLADNKAPSDECKDAPHCEVKYDAISSRRQVEKEQARDQLYEIPDHEFHASSASVDRVTDETLTYY